MNFQSQVKTIKAVIHKTFYIELIELKAGFYTICYECNGQARSTGKLSDLNCAMSLFEDIIITCEGH